MTSQSLDSQLEHFDIKTQIHVSKHSVLSVSSVFLLLARPVTVIYCMSPLELLHWLLMKAGNMLAYICQTHQRGHWGHRGRLCVNEAFPLHKRGLAAHFSLLGLENPISES